MRRALFLVSMLVAVAIAAAPAQAGKHRAGKPSGIKGVVLNTTCLGPCVSPPPPPRYTGGGVTVEVRRASDGALVASSAPANGHFRIRVRHGLYDVSAVTSQSPCGPVPAGSKIVCPLAEPSAQTCLRGDTQRVRVHRHRFTRVELHVRNVCVV